MKCMSTRSWQSLSRHNESGHFINCMEWKGSFTEAFVDMDGQSNDAFIRLDQLEVVISCYRFKSLIMMYIAFILEHFMWCFSPPSNFIHCFMRWYRWMAWRGLPTTNSFTRHSVSWAHLPNLLPSATACDPFKKKKKKVKIKTWNLKRSVWIVYQDITQVSQRAGSGFKQRSSLSHLCSWEDLPLPSAALHRVFLLKYLVFAKTNNDQRNLIASTTIFFWI